MRAKRKSIADEAGTGRELVALTDGPWRGRWYWADEFAEIQETARRYPPEHPSGQLQAYGPSSRKVTHPDESLVSGTAYIYKSGRAA